MYLSVADCFAGYYCLGGAIRGDPQDNVTGQVCPERYYCPVGSWEPIVCDEGTYSNTTGLAVCLNCPAGMYCQPDNDPVPCPQGECGHDWFRIKLKQLL